MGIVVKKNAGVDTIFADGRTALTRGVARGGRWQELAEQRIAPVLALLTSIDGQIAAAREEAEPLRATRDVENHRADALIGRVSDDAWNAVGRPRNDPALTLIFPGGVGYYTEGEVEEQPDRMEILAQLLESNLHPKLSAAQGQAFATEVRASADVLRAATDAARGPLTRIDVLERVRTALGRNLAMELAKLKRLYKAEGFTEAEIHAVIPDRPRESAAPAPKPA